MGFVQLNPFLARGGARAGSAGLGGRTISRTLPAALARGVGPPGQIVPEGVGLWQDSGPKSPVLPAWGHF
jgi:hypothetical protein